MDALLLLYNLIQIVLFCLPILLSVLLLHKEKNPVYRYMIALFAAYIVDTLTLYLIDFSINFSAFYKSLFFYVPTLKTLIYAVSFFCIIKILENLLHHSTPVLAYISYVALMIFMLSIPGMDNSILKLILYYAAPSIWGIGFGFYALLQFKKLPKDIFAKDRTFFQIVIYSTLLFPCCILIEDLFSISRYSSYLDLRLRSISEDIMSICFALLAIIYLIKKINKIVSDRTIDEIVPEIPVVESPASLSDFFLFCKEYQLTTREQDIMTLLLENKSNDEISDELQISIGTAKAHIHNIYLKLNVKKRRQLLERYNSFCGK